VVALPDGKRLHVNIHHLPVAVANDGSGHVITVIEDVTGAVALQEEKIRTERLAAINETMVSVNHEVNNPLAVILGYAQMRLRKHEGAGADQDAWVQGALEDLRAVETEALRIGQITRKLSSLVEPVVTRYPAAGGVNMVDVNRSR
jgi:signal transduction histidine kinase